jgi:hypothetical protein
MRAVGAIVGITFGITTKRARALSWSQSQTKIVQRNSRKRRRVNN